MRLVNLHLLHHLLTSTLHYHTPPPHYLTTSLAQAAESEEVARLKQIIKRLQAGQPVGDLQVRIVACCLQGIARWFLYHSTVERNSPLLSILSKIALTHLHIPYTYPTHTLHTYPTHTLHITPIYSHSLSIHSQRPSRRRKTKARLLSTIPTRPMMGTKCTIVLYSTMLNGMGT